MDRRYKLESLRRSIAMLTPQSMALNREHAGELLDRLCELEKLVEDLRRLLYALDGE